VIDCSQTKFLTNLFGCLRIDLVNFCFRIDSISAIAIMGANYGRIALCEIGDSC